MSVESLFLCHRLPFPPNKGDKIRSHAWLAHLAQKGPVHLGCFVDDKEDMAFLDTVRAIAGGDCQFIPIGKMEKWTRGAQALLSGQPVTTAYFGSRTLAQWIHQLVTSRPLDNMVVFGSAMAPYLLGDQFAGGRVLLDMVDVDSDKWRQYASSSSGVAGWIYAREAFALEDLERRAARQFGKTLLVSPFEAETFRSLAPESAAKIDALANGVDLERFSPGAFPSPFSDGELPIVMTGRMDYRPNFFGATWFAQQIGPRIFERLPSAHLYLVGSNPPRSLQRLAGSRLTVTGSVDDVRPYVQHAAVVVAPLLIARGVQNKVLEAMSMGKVIVATHEATRALSVTSGEHLWIENDPVRFADAVVRSVQSPTRTMIMNNARHYVEEHHNWKQMLCALDVHLDQLRSKYTPKTEIGAPVPRVEPQSSRWRMTNTEAQV